MVMGPESRKMLLSLGNAGTVGIELVVSTCIGFFGGRWIDTEYGTAPFMMWFGLAFGLAAGFRSLYRLARKTQTELQRDSRDDSQ